MNMPPFQEMLSSLIGEPSVSSTTPEIDRSNLPVVGHLANWLEGLGFSVDVQRLPDAPHKANLVATLGPTDLDPEQPTGVVLAGHTDTVPCDESLWQTDPFAMTDQDDKWYGLGACDMKGFFPIALSAIAAEAAADPKRLNAPLTVVATCDEESSMAGGRFLAGGERPPGQCAIIGEPTDLTPIYAHKGIAMISIKLEGASGHSSNPDLGCNALDSMHNVMGELIAFRQELAAQHNNPAFEVAVPTLNLGCMHAGDNPNRICGHAELQIDLRLLPGMDTDNILEALHRRISTAIAQCGTRLSITPHYPPIPPFQTDPQGQLVRQLAELSGNAPNTVAFGTEGHFLQSLGLETVIFGPGSIDQAHQPNEFLAKDQLAPATDILRQVIRRHCLTA